MAYSLLLALVVGGYYAIALPQYLRAIDSESWPTADGFVVRSQVKQVFRRGSPSNRTNIEYRFAVAGQEYSGTRIAWLPDKGHIDNVQPVVDTYPVGRKVEVYYNADEPDECLLVPGLHHEQKAAWIAGTVALVLFFAAGLFVINCPAAWARMRLANPGRA